MINQTKPSASISNSSKVSFGETWTTVTSTWATETRTWLAISQLITNQEIIRAMSIWSVYSYPWLEAYPWQASAGMTNQAKP